jgi:signal transduction histidine kinase
MTLGERSVSDLVSAVLSLKRRRAERQSRARRGWTRDLESAAGELWSSLARAQRVVVIGLLGVVLGMLVVGGQASLIVERGMIASHEGGLARAARQMEELLPTVDGRLSLGVGTAAALDHLGTELAERGTYIRLWKMDGTLVYSTDDGPVAAGPDAARRSLLETVAMEGSIVNVADAPKHDGRIVDLYASIADPVTGRPVGVLESFEYLGHVDAGLEAAQAVLTASLFVSLGLLFVVAALVIVSLSRSMAMRRAEERQLGRRTARHRMVADLHDSVASDLMRTLYAVRRTKLAAESDVVLADAMSSVEQMLETAEQRLRDLMHDAASAPASDADLLLTDAIHNAVEQFETQSGITAVVRIDDGRTPVDDPGLAQDLLRALDEALLNVRKHADARRVEVVLSRSGGWLTLIVADDGRGWCDGDAEAGRRLGLAGIRDRAADRGGLLSLRTAPAGGALIEVRLPVAP